MRSRIFFFSIVTFWVVMNYLLWRSQWGAHSRIGNDVPPNVVWEKIINAPDSSSLEIYDHDHKIGFCHWMASVENSPINSPKAIEDDYAPEGMASGPVTGYNLILEGNTLMQRTNRIRFEGNLSLTTNRQWNEFRLHFNWRTSAWDFRALSSAQKLMVEDDERDGVWSKTFTFAELQNPEMLLQDFGGGDLSLPIGFGLLMRKDSTSQLALALKWQAREDWMQFGHSRVRVYRLETDFLGQHLYFFISRVGEILWVELPDRITLRNEAFEHF